MTVMRGTWVLLALCACGDDGGSTTKVDAMVDDSAAADAPLDADLNMPLTLAETGLCVDAGCTQIAPGVVPYTPRFQLYSDGATKKRWIYLPPGTQINTTNMDRWEFPVGTKLWKEFTRGTTRVETRLEWRVGPGTTVNDWFYASYVWNATQDATHWPEFGEDNANGTDHDVPGKFQCRQCHENAKPSRVLGFSALSLDYDGAGGELDLADLASQSLLSAPPTSGGGAFFPFEALSDSSTFQSITYLHANCGHCHNPNSGVTTTQIDLRLTVGTVGDTETTPVYTTAVGVDAALSVDALVIAAGDANNSVLINRFESTNTSQRMPQLGIEINDAPTAVILRDWVDNIPTP
jgi:hypothetical protein